MTRHDRPGFTAAPPISILAPDRARLTPAISVPNGASAFSEKAWSDGSTRQATTSFRKVVRGTTLVLGGAIVWQASNFAFNAVGAHALGPAHYGVLAASMALLSFATPLLTAVQSVASRAATSLSARRQLAKVESMLHYYGLWLTAGAIVLGGVIAVASGWVSSLFNLGSPWLVVIVGATIPCYVAGHLFGGVLQGVERFGRFGLESVVEGATKAVLGVVAMGMIWRSPLSGMTSVIISSVVGLVTYLLLSVPLLCRNALSPADRQTVSRLSRHGGAHRGKVGASETIMAAFARDSGAHRGHPEQDGLGVARYSVTALVTYGLLALMLSSDTLVAKHYLSNHQAGLYAGASLTGKISYFAASSLFVVTFPLFSRHHDQGLDGKKWILAAGGLVCAITALIVAFYAVRPTWVVGALLGGRYHEIDRYIPWMAAVFGLYALGYLSATYLLARARRRIILVLAIAVTVQFAGFFALHASIANILLVLTISFATLLFGGTVLIVIGDSRKVAIPESRDARQNEV